MPNSLRFARLVESAYKSDDLSAAVNAFNEWQSSNCYHPIKQLIYDAHSQEKKFVYVPCGSCYHCVESRVNEWVTRMYAHAEDFKNVYFITLTYRSISDRSDVNRLLLQKLVQAVWHLDSNNSTHNRCYRPCLLVKKHYQDFLKRLRKYTGLKDITYVLCGEYGSKFGSPHFHAVLFTNGVLTRADIVRAWSVALFQSEHKVWSFKTNQKNGNTYYFPIGRVDFNDLVSNGTFNTGVKIKVDNNFYSAGKCFAYVCKYITKRAKPNLLRVSYAYNNLFTVKTFVRLYENEIPLAIACDYLREHGYPYSVDSNNLLYNNQLLNKLSYEKKVEFDSPLLWREGLQRIKFARVFGHDVSVSQFPETFTEFCDLYSPFVEFSRSTPIGSLYAARHLQEFKEGVYNKPILQDTSFVVPSYFRTKARNDIYGLRQQRTSIKGVSYCYGALSDFRRLFEAANVNDVQLPFIVPLWRCNEDYKTLLREDFYTLRDLGTGEKMLILPSGRVKHFKYSRSLRYYVNTRDVPVADWIRFWCAKLQDEYTIYSQQIDTSKANLKASDFAMCLLTDMGKDSLLLREDYEKRQNNYLNRRQFDYDQTHIKND